MRPGGGTPTSVAVAGVARTCAPRRRAPTARRWRRTRSRRRPSARAPARPHRRRDASTTSVAPSVARERRASPATTSTATIRSAPASRAPCTTASPTPPQPMTATDAPCAHGRRPQRGAGAGREAAREQARLLDRQLVGNLHRARLVHDRRGRRTSRSAAPASAARRRTARCIARAARGGCSSSAAGRRAGTRGQRRRTARATRSTTRSPGATIVTLGPTSSTMPAPSWPSRIGNRMPQPPVSTTCRSEWQTPHASTRTCTSFAPGASSVISSTPGARPARRRRAPRVTTPARRSCSSSGTSGSWNVSTALGSRDDVVAELRASSAGRASPARRAGARSAPPARASGRTARGSTADASRAPRFSRVPELVPRQRVRPADLERAARPPPAWSTARAKYSATSSTQIGCSRCVPGADDRRHRREAREPHERRQHAAVLPEDEARPEDDVLEAGRLDRALHLPLRGEVRHGVLRPLVQPERAREHEAAAPPRPAAAATRLRVPCAMTRSKSAREPLMIATRWMTASTPAQRGAQRRRSP